MRRAGWFLPGLIAVAFAGAFIKQELRPGTPNFQAPAPFAIAPDAPLFETHFASSQQGVQVHAASAVELKDGRIRAFWFSGSHEGAADVSIHSAVFDPASRLWGGETVAMTRARTQQALHRFIAKLGNPVVVRVADGSLRMIYVTVSVGGWAGSALATAVSHDEGASWSAPRRLVTSPFLNISTLVKGTPFLYGDGTLGVPVYHEFISKFGEILRLDATGRVLDKQRLAAGGQGTLQPVVLVQGEQVARVLMRYAGSAASFNVVGVTTQDAGRHWSAPQKLTMHNPDAAVTGVAVPGGNLLAVLNNQEHGRDTLSLMVSADGGANWRELQRLEDQQAATAQPQEAAYVANVRTLAAQSDASAVAQPAAYVDSARRAACKEGRCRYEFSYPYLIRTRNGEFDLLYTWNRAFIKHVRFNQAWLDERMKDLPHAELH